MPEISEETLGPHLPQQEPPGDCGMGELKQPAEHSGGAIYSQVQMVTRQKAPSAWQEGKTGEQKDVTPRVASPPLASSSLERISRFQFISASGLEKQQNQLSNGQNHRSE